MARGVTEVAAVGGVSFLARTSDGATALQLTVTPLAYREWMIDSLNEMLDRIDPQMQLASSGDVASRLSLSLVPSEDR